MCNLLIDKREYNVIGILDNEANAIKSFENDFSGESFINNTIDEIAKKNIPTSYYDVWHNVKDIEEYIEEAISREFLDPNVDNFNLVDMFRSGYYLYYQNALSENLDAMIFNKIVVGINGLLSTYPEEKLEQIAIEEIESELITLTEKCDFNKRITDFECESKKIIDKIKSGEFNRVN